MDFPFAGCQQTHDQPCQGRFATSRFPHHTERIAALNIQVDAVDRMNPLAVPAASTLVEPPRQQAAGMQREALVQATNRDQRGGHIGRASQGLQRVGEVHVVSSSIGTVVISSRTQWQATWLPPEETASGTCSTHA